VGAVDGFFLLSQAGKVLRSHQTNNSARALKAREHRIDPLEAKTEKGKAGCEKPTRNKRGFLAPKKVSARDREFRERRKHTDITAGNSPIKER